ncbi:hypothetical protein HpCK35_18920 [Helicobacter pylori]|nr:type I restriction-modification system, S subunit [Campylobacter jejuni subsp. doylei]
MTNLPQGWEVKTIDNTCEILDNKRVPISQKNRISGIYPYYGASGIVDYIDKYIFDEELVLIGEDGAKWGAFENSAFIVNGKYWVNNHAHILKPNNEILINKFLVYFLNYSNLEKYITGATVKKLNQQKLKQIKIPLPPIKEQERIVGILDFAFSKIDENIKKAKENLANIDELMQSALQKAFNPLNDNTKENYQLPQGWEWKSLGDVANIKGGKRLPKNEKLLEHNTSFAYIRVADFQDNGTINLKSIKFINENTYNILKNYKIYDDNLYISIAGTIGKSGIIPKELNGAILTENAVKLEYIIDNILNRYMYFFTISNIFKAQAEVSTKIVAQPKLAITRLNKFKSPYHHSKSKSKSQNI